MLARILLILGPEIFLLYDLTMAFQALGILGLIRHGLSTEELVPEKVPWRCYGLEYAEAGQKDRQETETTETADRLLHHVHLDLPEEYWLAIWILGSSSGQALIKPADIRHHGTAGERLSVTNLASCDFLSLIILRDKASSPKSMLIMTPSL